MNNEQQQADEDLQNILAKQKNEHIPESIMEVVENGK